MSVQTDSPLAVIEKSVPNIPKVESFKPRRLRRDDSLNFGNGVKVSGQIQGKEYAMCRTGAAGQTTLGVRDGAQEDGGFLVGMGNDGRAIKTPGRNARKAASALIAVIPKALSDYIARVHYPAELSARTGETR